MTLIETFPNVYDGGLALCGPLAPASWFMASRVFDIGTRAASSPMKNSNARMTDMRG